ncbi:SCP domain-containing protein [Trichostrongylus colubriformis]|uniref:SCP domain-containing protein n=1 Tax=Trichostrongylus colubriformis TaxID=6319 RepID=A0AAN8FWY6_TRICO
MTTGTLLLLLQVVLSLSADGEAIDKMCPDDQDMNDRIRSKVLEAHNTRRMKLARGEVFNKRGINLPQASNMRKLKYDCNLEKSAVAAAAATCSTVAQRNIPTDVQENAHILPGSTARFRDDAIVEAINIWWRQVSESGGIGHGVTYTSKNVDTPTEWFVRMASANTQSFGCGVVKCGESWSAVCHYNSGATVDQRIYEPGLPCSACPSGTTCSDGLVCA